MLELLFILFILTKNFFWTLGALVSLLIVSWVLYVAFTKTGYRPFCKRWWKEILDFRTYWYILVHYYQRLRYGISDEDAWDLDIHLLNIIPRGLKRIRDSEYSSGHISEKDWNDMILGIENYMHEHDCADITCPISHNQLDKDFRHALELLVKHFDRLWI